MKTTSELRATKKHNGHIKFDKVQNSIIKSLINISRFKYNANVDFNREGENEKH